MVSIISTTICFSSFKLFDLIIRGIEEHTVIGSFAETLVSHLQAAISLQAIRSAVLHFCCILQYEYAFNCVQCDYYSPTLISNVMYTDSVFLTLTCHRLKN